MGRELVIVPSAGAGCNMYTDDKIQYQFGSCSRRGHGMDEKPNVCKRERRGAEGVVPVDLCMHLLD